jgi:NAD(P)-dependent dehydrogenase (short-subunit alcohol dehydrogenase family)
MRRVLITGGAGGLGLASARRMAEAGMQVVLTDLSADALKPAVASLPGTGHTAHVLDVADETAVVALFERVEATGSLAALALFAGIGDRDQPDNGLPSILNTNSAQWQAFATVNGFGTYLCMREFLRHRYAQPVADARIVTLASLAGQMGGNIAGAAYAASKAMVIGLTKNVARQVAAQGVCVNCISPGAIDTVMHRQAAGVSLEGPYPAQAPAVAAVPMKRIGLPEEVAGLAAFLVSPEAGYISGQVIGVNGGIAL